MFSQAGVTEVGKKLWNERLRRMYEKNIGLRRHIARSLQHREVSTPAGIYLGRGMTIRYNGRRLEAVAMKIVRGLYFHERGVALDSTVEVMSLFLTERPHYKTVEKHNHMLKPGSIQWNGTFQYRCGFIPDNPVGSMWLLWFWNTHIFWVITSQQGTAASIAARTTNHQFDADARAQAACSG